MKFPSTPGIKQLVRISLREDIGKKDVTTDLLIPAAARRETYLVAKSDGVISGLPLVRLVFAHLDHRVRVKDLKKDGDWVKAGTRIARITGPLRSILTGERVGLNFLSHLSGIATITRQFVKKIKPYQTQIMDTRKTLPSLRLLEKYAVRCGGGVNQRMNLYEAVMVKDNHLEAIQYDWKKLARSLSGVRGKPIVVEVDHLSFLPDAIRLRPHVILLDNMTVAEVKKAVSLVRASGKKILLEVSGRVSFDKVRDYARTGVERISIGALTHSAPHLDFSLDIFPEKASPVASAQQPSKKH